MNYLRMGLIGLSLASVATTTNADWTETANGSLDQTWDFAGINTTLDGPAPFTQTIASDQLRLQGQLLNGTGAVFGTVDDGNPFTDVKVTADVQSSSDNFYGLGLRSNGLGDAYLFLINPHEGWAEIVEVGSSVSGDALQIGTSNNFDTSGGSFFLEFEAIGTQLTGRVFDTAGGSLLATATTNDGSYASGFSGVFASLNTDVPAPGIPNDIDASWDNITSVPEPSSLALLALGGLMIARRRR